jgi:aspartate/methionine/tyrosine aminotransferase
MFSSRVPGELEPNRLTLEVRRARASSRPLLDLTLTNPTASGIQYPPSILDALSDRAALRYEPQPLGMASARGAVARDYARRGITANPDRVVLTASTSEAYSILFKLLCEAEGDAVMVPVPSYPLFDHLTRLDGVTPIPYRLEYHGRWSLGLDTLDAGWTGRVRAVLAVSPNNPTGSMLTEAELAELEWRCAGRDAALIIDEVFADYPLGPASVLPISRTDCLTFRLGGLSKSAALPQVKLGWILVDGPEPLAGAAIDRLELISDTYLSVSTPVQVAAPSLIDQGTSVRDRILDRVRTNYESLRALAASYPSIALLPCDGGWSAVLRVASTKGEEDLVLDLLALDEVLVHPGFFFDFAHEAFLVLSLLPEPSVLAEGARRVMERAHV